MKLHIAVMDPPGYEFTHFLFDIVRLLCHGLEALGHSCTLGENHLDSGRINLIVGAHNMQDPKTVAQIQALAPRYVVVQTEILIHGAVNLTADQRQMRDVYLRLLQGATAVWEFQDINLPFLAHHGMEPDLLRLGYHPALEDVVEKRERDIDLLFFGSITPSRKRLLQALQQEGLRLHVAFDPVSLYRNDLIARSRVVLNPKQGDEMPHSPQLRTLYAAHNRRPVICDGVLEPDWYADICLHAGGEPYVDVCRETLARADLDSLGPAFHDALRTHPQSGLLEPVLERL